MAAWSVGDRCFLQKGKRSGIIKYIGTISELPSGEWIGIQLDTEDGKNNGSVHGTVYFTCPEKHGVFVREGTLHKHAFASDARKVERGLRAQALLEKQDPIQNVTLFWKSFKELEIEIKDILEKVQEWKVGNEEKEVAKIPDGIHKALHLVACLREETATGSVFLSKHDVGQAQKAVTHWNDKMENVKHIVLPKKKFSFRSKNNNTVVKTIVPEEVPIVETIQEKPTYADLKNQVLIINEKDIDGKEMNDLSFSNLDNCVVVIIAGLYAIRADHLSNCRFYVGPIAGSILLHHCTACTFNVATRQIRIHTTHDCTFLLRTRSTPIIEDCSNVRFGPYLVSYDGLEAQLKTASLENDSDLWKNVKDFKWHKTQPSPNWRLCTHSELQKVQVDETVTTYVSFDKSRIKHEKVVDE